jgi:catechol 2,3-dioxygenase-like lactoylglutathione lyase family enzyme
MQTLGKIALVVADYDEALDYFVGTLGFDQLEDTDMGGGKRWVVVAPSGGGCALLLAKAKNDEQRAAIGKQTGGRVFLFLETQDFDRDYERYDELGVDFIEEPRRESYGKVVVFRDLYGNLWDLVGRNQ